MAGSEPTRFADGRPMLMAGLRREHTFAGAAQAVPEQWQDFHRMLPIAGQVGTEQFGVICAGDAQRQVLEYMCAIEVERFEGLPPSVGRLRVPAQHYAVFDYEGPPTGISGTWEWIFSQWLPRSGYRSAETPDFERYGERYDAATGGGVVELWVPVERADGAGSGA